MISSLRIEKQALIAEAEVSPCSQSKGRASCKIDRSFAAVAEAVLSGSPDDRNQG
jgi:hypothetical protein